jgi:hypothetical protein
VAPEAWPNLFIVGAARAGTTSLWLHLGRHPDIYMSPVKEPHFFSPAESTVFRKIQDEDKYLQLFSRARYERYRGEASHSYLWDPCAPRAIKSRAPDARVLVTLRDPVERAYSAYLQSTQSTERRTFLQAVEDEIASSGDCPSWCVGRSFYAESVARHLEEFGERLHILFFDDLVHDAGSALREIFEFLEIDASFVDRIEVIEVRNGRSTPRNAVGRVLLGSPLARRLARNLVPLALAPRVEALLLRPGPRTEMDPRARELLGELFEPDTERLRSLLDRPVPW